MCKQVYKNCYQNEEHGDFEDFTEIIRIGGKRFDKLIPKKYLNTFRVSRTTLNFILSKIQHRIQKEYVTEVPFPPEQRFAICLYRLGRGGYLYAIAEMVGLAESTVCQIGLRFAKQ